MCGGTEGRVRATTDAVLIVRALLRLCRSARPTRGRKGCGWFDHCLDDDADWSSYLRDLANGLRHPLRRHLNLARWQRRRMQ
jgi:hypothetical protein